MHRILVCAVLVLQCVSVFAFQQEESILNEYFSHPGNRNGGVSPRIIGGEEVPPHSYPFQAFITAYKGISAYLCGGTLISPNLVLTAAHCVDVEPDHVIVSLGFHDIYVIEPESVRLGSPGYIIHQNWSSELRQNDIALVRLSQSIAYNEYIQPIKLATGSDKYEGEEATLLGWGTTETESSLSVLRRVNATVLTNTDCANSDEHFEEIKADIPPNTALYADLPLADGTAFISHHRKASPRLIVSSHICTSGAGPVGACFGDSGGPLVVDGVLVGIASFGTTNCSMGLPTVFTRVSEFYDWIEENAAN